MKVGHKNSRKIKINALKWSARNKPLENRQVLIRFWSKKCPVEKAQADQNVTAKRVKKTKWARQVKLSEP